MRRQLVPVTIGSGRFREAGSDAFLLTEAWFPPHAHLIPHRHGRGIFAIMLEGAFETRIGARSLACNPATAWTEPREERHANLVGRRGARVLVMQMREEEAPASASIARLMTEVRLLAAGRWLADAHRLVGEIGEPDQFTSLAIDSLATSLFVSASRGSAERWIGRRVPAWLLRARDLLHDEHRDRHGLAEIARSVEVTPSRLAHAFRRHYGVTVGEYARALRREWALEQLVRTDRSVAEVAIAAGYSDQSHFTRDCRRVLGVPPAEYRRQRGA